MCDVEPGQVIGEAIMGDRNLSYSYSQAKLADTQTILNCIGMPSHIWGFRERFTRNKSPRNHEEKLIYAIYVRWFSDGIPENYGSVSHGSDETAVSANAVCPKHPKVPSLHFPSCLDHCFDRMKKDILVNKDHDIILCD